MLGSSLQMQMIAVFKAEAVSAACHPWTRRTVVKFRLGPAGKRVVALSAGKSRTALVTDEGHLYVWEGQQPQIPTKDATLPFSSQAAGGALEGSAKDTRVEGSRARPPKAAFGECVVPVRVLGIKRVTQARTRRMVLALMDVHLFACRCLLALLTCDLPPVFRHGWNHHAVMSCLDSCRQGWVHASAKCTA
jgi:hypothetical protein